MTYACENGHTDVADVLLQAGADLVRLLLPFVGKTWFETPCQRLYACRAGSFQQLSFIYEYEKRSE